jgi:acetyltransferase-like isoleucine patch superfamily enzyme
VCGGNRIEKNVTFGAGSIVEPGIEIGKNNNIVAGTVVRENMERHYRKESNL